MNSRLEERLNDLKSSFPEMPGGFRQVLMTAARSVKEERKMKRFTLRTALIAALLIIATMTAALAATDALGWTDFFIRYETTVPKAAQEIINATEEKSYQVGPLTFTVKQLLCDGHLTMSTTDIRTTDGSQALYCFDPGESLGCNGQNGNALANRLGLPPETTYTEAARQLNLPLYCPRAILIPAEEYNGGEEMEDPLWNEDNTMTYFSMAYLDQDQAKGLDALPTEILLRVSQIDPETGEEKEDSRISKREPIEIPVQGVIAEKDYAPVEPFILNGYTLVSVHAEQTVAGLYLDRTYEAGEEAKKIFEAADVETAFDIICGLWKGAWVQENGKGFPDGISLTGEYDDKDYPILHFRDMISVDEMPQTLILETDDQQVTLE